MGGEPPVKLQVNPRHPLVKNLAGLRESDGELATLISQQLPRQRARRRRSPRRPKRHAPAQLRDAFLNAEKPELVINVALPYQDLPLMDACLAAGVPPRHRKLRATQRS